MKKSIFFILLTVICFQVFAQIDSLIALRRLTIQATSEEERIKWNQKFIELLEKSLTPSFFELQIDTIPAFSLLESPDHKLKIYNWNLAFDDGTHAYFGYVQVKQKDSVYTYRLSDKSDLIKKPERKITTHNSWYGALYYDIIPVKHRRKKYYVLLGWDGNNLTTKKKI
ncbi:MAG: hypothetical protein D6707_09275, partial [Bacteroidetes bacterium]